MKKIVLSLMMVLCIGSMASAQNQNDNQRPPRQQPTPEQMVEMRANMLEKELNLTSSQKAAITQILNDDAAQCKQEMEANKDKMKEHKGKKNDKKARPERRPMDDKMMARQQETDKKIEAVLDANQKEQYAQLKQRQHHGHHGHRPRPANGWPRSRWSWSRWTRWLLLLQQQGCSPARSRLPSSPSR